MTDNEFELFSRLDDEYFDNALISFGRADVTLRGQDFDGEGQVMNSLLTIPVLVAVIRKIGGVEQLEELVALDRKNRKDTPVEEE